MTLQNWLTRVEQKLSAANITSSHLDAQLLAAHALAQSREWILAHPELKLADDQLAGLNDLAQQRANHTPLAHLTGHRQFFGIDFLITPDVLTPRPESEPLIEWAAELTPKHGRVIDIGTGSGALAIALAKRRPDLDVTATDISVNAIKVARRNAKLHDVKISFIVSDLWTKVMGNFDTVITNLPYLQDNAQLMPEVQKEPAMALFGGPDGLDIYRRMLAGLLNHLIPTGYLLTECDPWQQDSLKSEAAQFSLAPIREDYFILGFQHKSAS